MKAVVLDGTAAEIADALQRMGIAPESITSPVVGNETRADDPVLDYVRRRVRGNAEKEQLIVRFLEETSAGDLFYKPGERADGSEQDYLRGRLATVDENRIGNVVYLRPASMVVTLRLPAHLADGSRHARPVDSQKPAEEFAKVKHQVTIKLINEEAVIEAVRLVELAVSMAEAGQW